MLVGVWVAAAVAWREGSPAGEKLMTLVQLTLFLVQLDLDPDIPIQLKPFIEWSGRMHPVSKGGRW